MKTSMKWKKKYFDHVGLVNLCPFKEGHIKNGNKEMGEKLNRFSISLCTRKHYLLCNKLS